MCPASPQSITRCAILIPAPATFARSFTSMTPLTGPLCTPMRTRRCGRLFSALLISSAHSTGASGLWKKPVPCRPRSEADQFSGRFRFAKCSRRREQS